MNAHSSARRKPRQFVPGLVILLSILLAVGCFPASASELAISPLVLPKPQAKQVAAKPAKKPAKKVSRARRHAAATPPSNGARAGLRRTADDLALKSSAALVVDLDTGETLAVKNPDVVLPIASLTKLMTALVVLDAKLPMDEMLEISKDDVDTVRNTYSRLAIGTQLSRDEMLLLALMSSENRAAMALSRNYPGGREAFIAQMNLKAQSLGMTSTHFADPAGLSNASVSTARDLHRLLSAAHAQPLIRADSTQLESSVRVNRRVQTFVNTNRLVRGAGDWNIELQKTGFTNEAGRCLVMQVNLLSRRVVMIFLDSTGTLTRYADAARVRKRLELEAKSTQRPLASAAGTTVAASYR